MSIHFKMAAAAAAFTKHTHTEDYRKAVPTS